MIATVFFYALVCTVYALQDGLGAYSSTGHLQASQTQYRVVQPAATTFSHAAPNSISATHQPAYPAAVEYAVPKLVAPQYSVLRLAAPEYSAPRLTAPVYSEPGVSTREYSGPRLAAPVYSEPGVPTYEYSGPRFAAPEYSAPRLAAPVYSEPGVSTREYSGPRLAAPEYSEPRLAAPVYSEPRVSTPEYSEPRLAAPAYAQSHQEEFAHPQYEYGYSIEDYHSGDLHSQQEQRNGEHVSGQYSLREADGSIRVVKYFDEGHGFNAVVEKLPGPQQEFPQSKN
ncbi:repetitive proline-rich cell wall protein 1 isoform X2 [Dendroctonus ponderosae]|uniref:repetitive proline-rich cell wall protein 1 isoform X2 n=1 Tax=Dendroctonus ponderosae TaxID=77166 RepID=UPI002034B948|nr:repetitive proline-rich cell wall protein 1 isoform X2 [Dendroctonus ponderosae]